MPHRTARPTLSADGIVHDRIESALTRAARTARDILDPLRT